MSDIMDNEDERRRTITYAGGLTEVLHFYDEAFTLVESRTVTDEANGYVRTEIFRPAIDLRDLRSAPRTVVKRHKEAGQ